MHAYWKLEESGIAWRPAETGANHTDDLEMTGLLTDYIVTYGADEDGGLVLSRRCIWPTLRTIPNNTHASYQEVLTNLPVFLINGTAAAKTAERFLIDGCLSVQSRTDEGLFIDRLFFPSAVNKNSFERVTLQNQGASPVSFAFTGDERAIIASRRGGKGVYLVWALRQGPSEGVLSPGESARIDFIYTATLANEAPQITDADLELAGRRKRLAELTAPLRLDTGNPTIDRMFHLAKIRAGESIYDTAGGLMHSPGGFAFHAATWCNDQAEYAGPYFAFTGDETALAASMNAYEMYMPFMSPDERFSYCSIPSSVIAEKTGFWEKDRGDEAMYAYGAALFALTSGRMDFAKTLYPAIAWCLEFCRRRINDDGVVPSETDELEGRFPSGNANLSTNTLYYGGLFFGAVLAQELGFSDDAARYKAEAAEMAAAIERTFGTDMGGFATYRYYAENTTLRSWICLPLCVGLADRLEGTLNAMLSPRLWTENGMLTEETNQTVWDRSTLYGFKGAFLGGRGDEIFDAFLSYCEKRLLGERVPYAVEAYPEGGRRHLSGESCLFCRIVTDGILGITPLGLSSFSFTPRIPKGLSHVRLYDIRAFGQQFDILVEPAGYQVLVDGRVHQAGPLGAPAAISF